MSKGAIQCAYAEANIKSEAIVDWQSDYLSAKEYIAHGLQHNDADTPGQEVTSFELRFEGSGFPAELGKAGFCKRPDAINPVGSTELKGFRFAEFG
ncbi:MAG: hypothetical protein MN733_38070 [Nitrososphaera sp.]|nr:hypothetical protein [Nitrososphaera sp.]